MTHKLKENSNEENIGGGGAYGAPSNSATPKRKLKNPMLYTFIAVVIIVTLLIIFI